MKKKYLLIGIIMFLFGSFVNIKVSADPRNDTNNNINSIKLEGYNNNASSVFDYYEDEKITFNISIKDASKEIKEIEFTFVEEGKCTYTSFFNGNKRVDNVEHIDNPKIIVVKVKPEKKSINEYKAVIPVKEYFKVGNYSLTAKENGLVFTYNDDTKDYFNNSYNQTYMLGLITNVFSINEESPIKSMQILDSNGSDVYTFYDRSAPLRLKVESKKSGIEKFVLTFRTNCNEESNDPKHSATVTVSHLMSDYYAMNLADTQLEDNYYYVCNFDAYYNDNTVYHYKRSGNVAGLSNSEYYYDSPLSRNYGFFYPPLNLISLKQNSVKLNEKLYLNLSLYKEAISGNLVFKQGDRTLTVSINDINTDFPYVVIPYTSPLGELTLSEVYLKTNALYSFARNQGETITFNYKDSNDGRTYYKLKRDFGDKITVEKDNTTIQSELLNLDNDSLTDEIIEDIKKVEGTTTINLDATKKSKVSSDLFELIKDKDITLNIHINDNIWSIYGKDIKIVKDIDVSTDLLKLDKSLSKKVGNGIVLSFKDNGKLPGKMTIRINNDEDVSAVLEGKPVYLYVFNEKEKNFDPVKEDIKLDDEGFYNLELDHNSKYVITSSKIKDKYLQGYVSNMPIIIGLTIFVLAAIGVVAFVLLKKPKEKKEEVKEEKKEEKKEVKKTKKETSKEIDEEDFVLNIKR